MSLSLWVIAAVNDGASPNRKFFELHSMFMSDVENEVVSGVVYKVNNLFAMDRFVFFFSDACHLIKTARNCLYNSGSGSRSYLMWNNDECFPEVPGELEAEYHGKKGGIFYR